ncbi:MAG: PKD domain-containing protein [Acidobacteriota bacterium]
MAKVAIRLVTLVLASASPALATTYVATNPSELQTYSDMLLAGDTLLVAPGTYTMSTWRIRNLNGTAVAGIVIQPQSGTPIIQGNANQNVVNVDDVHYVSILGFEITYAGTSTDIDGMKFNAGTNSDHVLIEDCYIHDVTGVGLNSKAVVLSDFDVHHCQITRTNGTGEGIYFGCHDGTCVVHDGVIRNCWIHETAGSQGDGIEIKRSSYRVTVEDNVVYSTNGYPGVTMYRTDRGNSADNNVVRRNAIWQSGEGIFVLGETNIQNNVIFDCDYGINSRNYSGWGMSDLFIANNTVFSCASVCIQLSDWGGATGTMVFSNNAAFQSSSGAAAIGANSGTGPATPSNNIYYGTSAIGGSTLGNPPAQEFVAPSVTPGVVDLYPLPTSTLVGAGTTGAGIPGDDYNLTARPFGGTNEVGAYELTGAGNPGWQIDRGFKQLGPVASFSGNPLSGPAPLAVQFTDLSSGSITAWAWTFGDGGTSALQNPSHTYGAAGSYDVALTVSGPSGSNTNTKLGYITVTGSSPVDNFLSGRGRGQPNANDAAIHALGGGAAKASWTAYGAGQWGTLVASGDVDGNATSNAITGPGPGPVYGPQVRAWQPDGTAIGKVNFYAYGTLRYGVNVAGANLDADAPAEMLSGAGPGGVFGPHVRGWNYDGVALGAIAKISFFAYSTLKYGVNVDDGDVDNDGFQEILTGPGPSGAFGATVRGFNYDGSAIAAIGKINFTAAAGGYGANPAGGSVDADRFDEILVGRGPGPAIPSEALGFDYDAASIAPLAGFDIVAFPTMYGARVSGGDVDGDAIGELVVAPGEDPAASAALESYDYNGSNLTQIAAGSFSPFGSSYGAIVATGRFGY